MRYSLCVLLLQADKRTGQPKIWIYKDKMSGKPKGEATITYDDANAAQSAIEWFGGTCLFALLTVKYIYKIEERQHFLKVDVEFDQ